MNTHRRTFLKAAGTAVSFPMVIPASALGKDGRPAPSERITIGAIGLGAMGTGDLNNHMNEPVSQVVAVCDVHRKHNRDKREGEGRYGWEPAKAKVEQYYARNQESGKYSGCDAYTDFRELCARKDIDAVIVATPDHWHARITLEALRNGKDVYCEKPVTHLFAEGQAVYKEVAKRKAIFQTGSQQRSDQRFRHCAELVMNGHLGKVTKVEVGLPRGKELPGIPVVETVPEGLDYDFWCGPSKLRPYHFDTHHRNWRWVLDYGGGQLMDWIGHHNDCAHWGLGLDKSGPILVEASGFTFPKEKGLWEAPLDYTVRSQFAEGVEIVISNSNKMGVKYIGEDGWVHVSRGQHDASDRRWLPLKFETGSKKAYLSNHHARNFLECVKSRQETVCPAETAHRSITPGHLGYVSHFLGRPLKWDPVKEEVIGDSEADRMLKAVDYREPWKLG